MFTSTLLFALAGISAWTVLGAPAPAPITVLVSRQAAVTPLSQAQINAFTPYTWFASTAYCEPSTTRTWTCGANCNANPGFEPVASGGDGALTQFWYVGYDPSLSEIIVANQGTDESKILPVIEDGDFFLTPLDSTLFPGLSGLEVHNGFGDQQSRSAKDILSAVQIAMSKFNATKVTIAGHSLGAAIGLIDFVYLPLHLPAGTTFKFVGYGLPRVGNQAFADYVDAHASSGVTHINNREDPVPILPGLFLGFHHPSGEVHIEDSGEWASCPGQDNPDQQCTTGDVSNIFEGNPNDHSGPYNGINIGC